VHLEFGAIETPTSARGVEKSVLIVNSIRSPDRRSAQSRRERVAAPLKKSQFSQKAVGRSDESLAPRWWFFFAACAEDHRLAWTQR
jgi:hypothetical protein